MTRSNGTPRNRLLDPLEHPGDGRIRRARVDEEMDVLRHHDVGPHLEVPPPSGGIQRIDEPLARTVAPEQA